MNNALITPTPTATIGLHSSASTWVFNVARELLIAAHTEDRVTSCYTDDPASLPNNPNHHLIIKSHHGSPALDRWLEDHNARIILSIRDPRDCCLSMAKRFSATLDLTTRWLVNDCARMMRLADLGHPLLRYEDRFFEQPATVACIVKALDLEVTNQTAIFERYRTEAVRAFTANLKSLPPLRLTNVGASFMDTITQIHATHIGDTSSGKWRQLSDTRQAALTQIFEPFLKRFEYLV